MYRKQASSCDKRCQMCAHLVKKTLVYLPPACRSVKLCWWQELQMLNFCTKFLYQGTTA